MIGSGKPLLGLWLYRSGHQWSVKHELSLTSPRTRRYSRSINQETSQSVDSSNHSPTFITTLIFTVEGQVGSLVKCLQIMQDLKINVLHIESRKKPNDLGQVSFDFLRTYVLKRTRRIF